MSAVDLTDIASGLVPNTPIETLRATYTLAKSLIEEDIPGDFVECGTYAGAHCAAMARAILDTSSRVLKWIPRVHLFDSFEGIPAATQEDGDWLRAGNPVGMTACPLSVAQDFMQRCGIPSELLVWHPGWFKDTLPVCGIERIALLRLDCDLYESTRIALEHLYPKVVYGGWIIHDDFVLDGSRKAVLPYIGINSSGLTWRPVYWRKVGQDY
jgi:hypothetical protein